MTKWWLTVLGVVLIAAPWVFGYSGKAGMILSVACGLVIALNGYFESYRIVGVVGLLTAVAPLILGSRLADAATWSLLFVGAASALLAGYQVFFVERRAEEHETQRHVA